MKRLVLLLALGSAVAQAETILMTCGEHSFRYSDGFLGLGAPTYERRSEAKWLPFCKPLEKKDSRLVCYPGEKGMVSKWQNHRPDGQWETSITQMIDFEVLEYVHIWANRQVFPCKRLNRG